MNIRVRNTLSWTTALLMAVLMTVAFPKRAAADDNDPPGRVARIRYLQGSVSFQPAGETDWAAAVTNRPMTTGDHLWADEGSRAEVQIGSAIIRLDANTGFSFLNLDDRTVQIQLTEGTLNLRVRRLGRDEVFEVDTPNQAFSVTQAGQYRVQAGGDGASSLVIVRQGQGEVTGGGRTYSVYSGQSGTFIGTDSLDGQVAAAGNLDDFDTWGQTRDRQYEGSRSARYVSPDVVGYEDLDNNGSWRSDPTYGNVWMPTSVESGWAPYHNGHWVWISPWGWTWVDDAPWGYAPFHYGRWVSLHGNWGWVPGPISYQPVYAPALVAFIGGPGFGVSISLGGGGDVGWFPLGPREAYVPGYNTSPGYFNRVNTSNTNISNTTITNIYNNQVTNKTTNITKVTYVNRTVPGAVTAVPQSAFRSSEPVARAAVAVNAKQLASAPVVSRAAVAPTRDSVLGKSAATANKVAQPPAAMANRPVVAKTTPPPPPVSFAKQQQELAKHPGQPLAPHEVQSLRPPNVAAAHPLVKQAPPGKPTKPGNAPVAINPGQPAHAQPANTPPNKPVNAPPPNKSANAPANQGQPAHTDRPPSAQSNNQPSPGNKPGTMNPSHPANAQPTPAPNKPSNVPPSQSAVPAPAKQAQPTRSDRPPMAQPNSQPPPASQQGRTNANRPANAQPASEPANKPANVPPARPAASSPTSPVPAPENRPVAPANRSTPPPPASPSVSAPHPPAAPAQQPGRPPAPANRSTPPPPASPSVSAPPHPPAAPAQQPGRPVAPANRSTPPPPASPSVGAPHPPVAPAQRPDRPPAPQPSQPPKAQPASPPAAQSNAQKQQAEKAKAEQQKKEQKSPPQ